MKYLFLRKTLAPILPLTWPMERLALAKIQKYVCLDLSLYLFWKLSQLIIAVFSSHCKCGLKERTDESFPTECYFLKLKIYSLTWFFNSGYSTLYRAVIPVRYILLNSKNSLCEFKKNCLYSSCTIYDYCYGMAQPNSKQGWKFHACSFCKALWKLVDNITLLFGTSEKHLIGARQQKV